MKQNLQVLEVTGQATASSAGIVMATLPSGMRIHSVLLALTAASTAVVVNYVGDTTFKVNGVVQRQLTPTQLDGINALNNLPGAIYGTASATPFSIYYPSATLAELELYFNEPWMPLGAGEKYALDIFDNETATVEVAFASVTPAPVVNFRVICEPLGDVRRSGRALNRIGTETNNRPSLVKFSRQQETPGAITLNMLKLNKAFSSSDTIQAIRLYEPTSRTIESVEVSINDRLVFQRTKAENGKELRSAGMNPAASSAGAGFFDIVPNATDNIREGWRLSSADKLDLKITYDASASAAQVAIVQHYGAAN